MYHNGYHGDANETFFVGKSVDDASRHLVKAAYECMMKGIAIGRWTWLLVCIYVCVHVCVCVCTHGLSVHEG